MEILLLLINKYIGKAPFGRTEIDVKINLLHSVVRGGMSLEAYQDNEGLIIILETIQHFRGKPSC